MARRTSTPPLVALWPLWGILLLFGHTVVLAFLQWRPGRTAIVPYLVAPRLLVLLTAIVIACALFDLMHSGWRRLLRGRILFDAAVLLTSLLIGLFAYRAYPSSYDARPARLCLDLPMDGEIVVLQGGASVTSNHHAGSPSERYAYDLARMQQGGVHRGAGTVNEDYYAYGQPVRAPAHGTVVAIEDGRSDHAPGSLAARWTRRGQGNFVILQIDDQQYLVVSHLQPGSIAVQRGDAIEAGTVLGRVGNSGRSDVPHLHLHLQDLPQPGKGEAIPVGFCRYEAVEWGSSWEAARVIERGMPTGGRRRQVIRAALAPR